MMNCFFFVIYFWSKKARILLELLSRYWFVNCLIPTLMNAWLKVNQISNRLIYDLALILNLSLILINNSFTRLTLKIKVIIYLFIFILYYRFLFHRNISFLCLDWWFDVLKFVRLIVARKSWFSWDHLRISYSRQRNL